MTQQRKRILKRPPMFAIGRNTKLTKPKPGTVPKRCRPATRPEEPHRTSIFMCLKNIPLNLLFELCGPSRTLINRSRRIQELEEIHNLYTTLEYKYKGLPYKEIHYETDVKQYWLRMEQKCIAAFRKLAASWLYKQSHKRFLNTEDPATCEVPVKLITVYDGQRKGTYVFEAMTIKKQVESALSYSEWMFPYPTKPTNPFTNIPFTDAQLVRILRELRRHGFGSWIFEGYKRLSFNLMVFRDVFMVPIKLRALHELMQDTNHEDMIDLLSEFIEDELDYHQITSRSYHTLLPWAVQHIPTHPYIELWRKLYSRYTSNLIVYGNNDGKISTLIETIHEESLKLFKNITEIRVLVELRNTQLRQAQLQTQTRVVTLYPSVSFVIS